jgi:hypothetical protein
MRQAKARAKHGEGKLVSLFEPSTEVIHKGKSQPARRAVGRPAQALGAGEV